MSRRSSADGLPGPPQHPDPRQPLRSHPRRALVCIDVHEALHGRLAGRFVAVPNLVTLIARQEFQGVGETETEALADCLRKITEEPPARPHEIASKRHFSKQVMQRMHFSLSMRAGSFFFQAIAPAGQARKQAPH